MIHLTAESILKGGDAEMVMASNEEELRDHWFTMLHVSKNIFFPFCAYFYVAFDILIIQDALNPPKNLHVEFSDLRSSSNEEPCCSACTIA